jgi:hypothetical protein
MTESNRTTRYLCTHFLVLSSPQPQLSYEIDDDAITKFFGALDAEVKAVRWLHHKDSGDFKEV